MPTHYNILEDKELFEYLGRALYECQRLEVTLASIIQDLHLRTGRIQGSDLLESLQELQKVLHSRPKRTLGMLLKELRKLAKLDNESECLLSKGIDKRNEIVHRFFYKHWVAMITPVGRNVMLDDLKGSIAIIRDTYELSDKIRKQLDALMKSDTDNSDEVR